MKKLLETFTKFLTESTLNDFDVDGEIHLYHYGAFDEDEKELDPEYFLSNTSHHSRKEKEVSDVPRSFFYTDLNNVEHQIAKAYNRKLYKAVVPITKVYDLRKDPDGFIQQVKHPVFGLRKGMEWNDLLNAIKEKYDGVFYNMGNNIGIVAWFYPIKVERVEEIPQG